MYSLWSAGVFDSSWFYSKDNLSQGIFVIQVKVLYFVLHQLIRKNFPLCSTKCNTVHNLLNFCHIDLSVIAIWYCKARNRFTSPECYFVPLCTMFLSLVSGLGKHKVSMSWETLNSVAWFWMLMFSTFPSKRPTLCQIYSYWEGKAILCEKISKPSYWIHICSTCLTFLLVCAKAGHNGKVARFTLLYRQNFMRL